MLERLVRRVASAIRTDSCKDNGIEVATRNSVIDTASKGIPWKSILNPSFQYVNSARTDVAETFKRERERLEALARGQDKPPTSARARPRRPA